VAYDWNTALPGIFARHAENCPVRNGGSCTCGPALRYRAAVRQPGSSRRILSPEFETVAEAQAWQRDQHEAMAASPTLSGGGADLSAVIDDFLQSAETGASRDRYGAPFAPETQRQLRAALSYVDSELGTINVQDLRRRHVQALIDELLASGVDPGRVVAIADALGSLYSHAIQRGLVDYSPVVDLNLPEPPGAFRSPTAFQTPYAAPQDFRAPLGYPTAAQPAPTPFVNGAPTAAYDVRTGSYPTGAYGSQNGTGGYLAPNGANGYATPSGVPPPPGYPTPGFPPPYDTGPGSFDSTMQERFLWWTVRIVVVVFVLIALVLAAESI
jgi:hypothetical protein